MHSRQAILSTLLPLAFLASTVSGFIRPMGFSAAGECHRHITLINLHQDPHSRPWLPSDRIRCQDCGGKLLIKEYSTSYLSAGRTWVELGASLHAIHASLVTHEGTSCLCTSKLQADIGCETDASFFAGGERWPCGRQGSFHHDGRD